jgi:hypothetical protein
MKKDFFLGFAAGVVLKDTVCRTISNVVYRSLTFKQHKPIANKKVLLIAKIKNQTLFDEQFPDLGTKFKTQPQWDYIESKNIIKIELDQDITEGLCDDYLKTTDIDIPFFKSFSELYIYVHYNYDLKDYINVYKPDDIICKSDFLVTETSLLKKYSKLVCATFHFNGKQVYATKYFRMFLNNKTTLSPEQLIMYNDLIQHNATLRILNEDQIINNLI